MLAAALLLLIGVANWDLISGRSTPFYRDLGTTQRPARAVSAGLGAAHLLPAASFGQPYLGNPNFVLAYPFPRNPRFLGLQLLLHAGLALAGAFVFFRRWTRSEEAALFGAFTFGLSGYVLSSTAFLNATSTIAWMPWLCAAAHALRDAEGRRRYAWAAAAAGLTALLLLGGEPALGALALATAFGLAATGPRGGRLRGALLLAAAVAAALLLLSPWLLEVLRASAFSTRRVRGFSWNEFAAVGFHPLRLLETPFPLLFGDPTRLIRGAFWGFAATQGNPPYVTSLCFGVLPVALAVVFAVSARRYEGRFFLGAAALSLLVSTLPWLPGAHALYDALPPLHALRYPAKALLVFTLGLAGLAALAADRLLVQRALPRFRIRASWALMAIAALFTAAAVFGSLDRGLAERLLLRGWNQAWASDPHVVLEPIVRRLPAQAALAAAALLVAAALLRRGAEDGRGRFLLLAAGAVELLLASHRLLPRVPSEWYERPSPLVARAAALNGRIFERTGKDLDPVRRGLFGRYPEDDVRALGLVQTLQGWALTGAPHGLRYAYDGDPDGSYTELNRMACDLVFARDWPRRLLWLRAAGVAGVIAHDVPAGLAGLTALMSESRAGIPTTLYALQDPLPALRRLSRVYPSRSVNEAVARVESAGFDPRTDGVVAGVVPPGLSAERADEGASAKVVEETADRLVIDSDGAAPGLLHVDRSFTPRARASVDGQPVKVWALDLHLIGVPVPPRRSRTVVELAP